MTAAPPHPTGVRTPARDATLCFAWSIFLYKFESFFWIHFYVMIFILLPDKQRRVVFVVWIGAAFVGGVIVGVAITLLIVELLRRRRGPVPRRGGIRIVEDPMNMLREPVQPVRERPPRPGTLYLDAVEEHFEDIPL